MRPLLFLDVDGVLNCPDTVLPHRELTVPWRNARLSAQQQANVDRMFIDRAPRARDTSETVPVGVFVPDGVVERVRELSDHFTMVWATYWESRAPAAWQPVLGMGADWPWLQFAGRSKLPQVFEHAAGHPFAFVDDDVSFDIQQADLVALPDAEHVLLLEPSASVGLTDLDVHELIAFADRHSS